jgi:enamine deaminase RidA (YjgF/YER057c/UK114 family)
MNTVRILAGRVAVPLLAFVLLAAGWLAGSLHAQSETKLKKDFINPSRGRFSGAVVVHGNGVKTIYVSGHTGRGDDLKTQAIAVYENVVKTLAAAGAKPEDVVKLNTFIANYTPDDRAAYEEGKRKSFPFDDLPASTMVGVQSLISPQNRIEVEAVAMVKE